MSSIQNITKKLLRQHIIYRIPFTYNNGHLKYSDNLDEMFISGRYRSILDPRKIQYSNYLDLRYKLNKNNYDVIFCLTNILHHKISNEHSHFKYIPSQLLLDRVFIHSVFGPRYLITNTNGTNAIDCKIMRFIESSNKNDIDFVRLHELPCIKNL
jgi:hypothetical protein